MFLINCYEADYVRSVIKVTVRHSNAKGQLFFGPQISVEGWFTTLPAQVADDHSVIKVYSEHAIYEQFNSEFKTGSDSECLPSGKFDTNDLVMVFAVLAYNILHYIGLKSLLGK
ncbi:MAG: hypothetical protein ACI9ES_000228 [Oceanospirillaceae bacterium]